MRRLFWIAGLTVLAAALAGCSGNDKMINQKNMLITELEGRVDSLRGEVQDIRGEKESIKDELETKLSNARENLEVCRDEKNRLTKIRITDAVRFEFGRAKLTSGGKEAIDAVWNELKDYPGRRVLIEGHTDDILIDEEYRNIFPTNWELSTARACAVLHYLIDKHGADPKRLTVSGYSKYHPMAGNDTPEGRAENRRVVISVRDTMD